MCKHRCALTFGLQALALPSWWRRARLELQVRSRDEYTEEALKLLSGIVLWSPRGREQPGHTHTVIFSTVLHQSSDISCATLDSTHCWDRNPEAPVGEQVFAQSLMDESWRSEPQMEARSDSLSPWSCPGCRESSITEAHKQLKTGLGFYRELKPVWDVLSITMQTLELGYSVANRQLTCTLWHNMNTTADCR